MTLVDVVNASLRGEISPDSIDYISKCPQGELEAFLLTYMDNWSIDHIVSKCDIEGTVRPHIAWPCIRVGDLVAKTGRDPMPWAYSSWNSISKLSVSGQPFAAADKLKCILLYAHGATLTDMLFTSGALVRADRGNYAWGSVRRKVTDFLIFIHDIMPLVESEVVDFLPPAMNVGLLSSDVDDAFLSIYLDGKSFPVEEAEAFSAVEHEADKLRTTYTKDELEDGIRRARQTIRRNLLQAAIDDLEAQIFFNSLIRDRKTLLAGSAYHLEALKILLDGLQTGLDFDQSALGRIRARWRSSVDQTSLPLSDVSNSTLNTLFRVNVPGLSSLRAADVVSIRAESARFETWRQGITVVLNEYDQAGQTSGSIDEYLAAHLGDLAEKATQDLTRQSIGDRLYGETRTFAIGLLPALAVTTDAKQAAVGALLYRLAAGLAVPTSNRQRNNSPAGAMARHYLALTMPSDEG